MNINIGDLVTRKSYNNDTVFKVLSISENKVYLKGLYVRLCADSNIDDLKKIDKSKDDFKVDTSDSFDRSEYFYLPGKILHIDGDSEYLERCLKYYKSMKVYAIGKKISEDEIANQLLDLLKINKPDIVVITGHDAYLKNGSYKNSKNFIKAIKIARKYEKSQEKLIVIAGACQSDYESLIKAGANFASSPKRVNIHALDPAIIATSIALTKRNEEIDLIKLLNKTKYGPSGIGGIITNGIMYVGYPR